MPAQLCKPVGGIGGMTVAETSIDAYHALRRDGGLSRQQALVMRVIKVGRDYSLQELVVASGLPVNCVSGRCFELKHSGALEHSGTRRFS